MELATIVPKPAISSKEKITYLRVTHLPSKRLLLLLLLRLLLMMMVLWLRKLARKLARRMPLVLRQLIHRGGG